MSAARRAACLAALACAACGHRSAPAPADAAPPPPPMETASAAIVEAAPDASAGAGMPAYPREGIAPLLPDCRSAHAYLGIAPYEQGSLQRRIRQAIAAHPEIEVIDGEPGPGQVKLTDSEYGGKNFSRQNAEKNRYAVIATCGDAETCLAIAAMVRAVVLDVAPELFCGHPRGLAGDGQPLRGPWRLPAAMPNLRDRLEVCARVTACSVRASGAPRDAIWQTCWKARVDRTGPCAGLPDCAEVARCFRELP